MPVISVTLPDGSKRDLEKGSTGADLASDIGRGLAKAAVIAEMVVRKLISLHHLKMGQRLA